VREFVPRTLVGDLDFSRLERVNTKFYANRRPSRRRDGDVIWRLPMRVGSDVYIYLLFEFQSTNDRWMAARAQVYQGLLWQQVIDEQKLKEGDLIPPLLVLVLYNGEGSWKAPATTRELIDLSKDSALCRWQPKVKYRLIHIGKIPAAELAQRSSLVALLFRLEQRHSAEDLARLLDEVIDWFRNHDSHDRLQRVFAELIREAFARHGYKLPRSASLLEVKTMLSTQLDVWREEWLAEGEAKGKAEGKAEGRTEGEAKGKADSLICLLVDRFGEVTASLEKKIRAATLASLDAWFKRALVAPNLRSVFQAQH